MPGKIGGQFKYSKPDGSMDIERIESLVDKYIAKKDREAKQAEWLKLTATERKTKSIDDMAAEGAYTVQGLCAALAVDRNTLLLWEEGLTSKPEYDEQGNDVSEHNYELSRIIKKAKALTLEGLEEIRNKNAIMSIFLLKNHANYVDKQEQDVKFSGQVNVVLGDMEKYAK